MANEIEIQASSAPPMTAVDIRAQVNRIQEVMKSVMQDGQHYGKIPGCGDKPTLLKAGAEKLIMTFRLAPIVRVEDLHVLDGIGYRVTVSLQTFEGKVIGEGVGECSSLEEKYGWREAVCPEEFESTPIDKRREKWKKGYQDKPSYVMRQVRTNPADQSNTILKMAKKRALVDATLTVLGASDIFTQDIEDMDFGSSGSSGGGIHTPYTPPKSTGTTHKGEVISEPQHKRLFAIGKSAGVTKEGMKALLSEFGFASSNDVTKEKYEEVCAKIQAWKPSSSPIPERITPEQVQALKQKWDSVAAKLSQNLRIEGAKFLREKFGFQTFEEIRPDQLIDVMVGMDEIREPGA